jgi:glycosyltransferase involved in cell wall biosynthesis
VVKTEAEVISVIVPVYNAEKYLRQCIDSIVNQTYRNLEIILVDDGSQDNSGKICDAYAETDKRIRVIHKQNGGQATARNEALKTATGEYIGFVDADDWIELDMYESLLSGLRSSNADLISCGRYCVDEKSGEKAKLFCHEEAYTISAEEAIKKFLLWDNLDSASCDKLFKGEIINGLSYPVGYICEDIPFVYSAIKKSKSVYMLGRPLYNYRQTAGSTSRSPYTERTKGLVLYPAEVRNDVTREYKTLTEEANFYYIKSIYYFLNIYFGKYPYGRPDVKYKLSCCIKNSYLDRKTKIKLILMKARLYMPILKVVRIMKRTK